MDENGDNVIRPQIGARLVSTDIYRKIRFPSIAGLQLRFVERRNNKNELLLLLLFYYYIACVCNRYDVNSDWLILDKK